MADSNSFITASWVAKKGLTTLHDKAKAAVRCNRNYEGLFGKPLAGVPLGTSIQARLPFKYKLRTGQYMSANALVQRTATLTLNNQNGVDLDLTSVERQMDIGDFTEQVINPAMSQISGGIESNICALATQVYNQVASGTVAGNTTLSFNNVAQARQYLTQMLVPDEIEGTQRTLLVNPVHNYEWVTSNAALYNPSEFISDQWVDGIIAQQVLGFLAFEETKLAGYTTGTYSASTPVIKAATAPGNAGTGNAFASTMTLSMTGWANSGTTLNAGDVFCISGCYAVDPETKTSLGRLQQFVVTTQISDTSGEVDAVVSPCAIYGGAYQNVSAAPLAGATICTAGTATTAPATISGSGGGLTFNQSIAFARDAILFANVPMQDVSEVVKFCAEESFDGFHLRVVQGYDINSDVLKTRLDNLSGEVLAYPEMIVRAIGT